MSDFKVKVVSASWCSQCGPYKKQLQSQGIEFENLDADDSSNMELLSSLGVRGLPTTLVYNNDELIGMVAGNKIEDVKELLNDC